MHAHGIRNSLFSVLFELDVSKSVTYWVYHWPCPSQIFFLKRMLMRDLFAVANLLVMKTLSLLILVSHETVSLAVTADSRRLSSVKGLRRFDVDVYYCNNIMLTSCNYIFIRRTNAFKRLWIVMLDMFGGNTRVCVWLAVKLSSTSKGGSRVQYGRSGRFSADNHQVLYVGENTTASKLCIVFPFPSSSRICSALYLVAKI